MLQSLVSQQPSSSYQHSVPKQSSPKKTSKVNSNMPSSIKGSQFPQQSNINNKESLTITANRELLYIFPLISFVANFNYSISNCLITILMITFMTPSIVDAFVWIIPNVLAILIRPFIIRYVHIRSASSRFRVYKEIRLLVVLLMFAGIGALMVAKSTQVITSYKIKKISAFDIALRIGVCTCGWTLVDCCFELLEFFLAKVKQSVQKHCVLKLKLKANERQSSDAQKTSLKESIQSKSKSTSEFGSDQLSSLHKQITQSAFSDRSLLGATAGYFLVLLVMVISIQSTKSYKMKNFHQECRFLYTIVGLLTIFSSLLVMVTAYVFGLPKVDPEQQSLIDNDKTVTEKPKILKLSFSAAYYLPGLHELKQTSLSQLGLILVHFGLYFMVDVILIYSTSWPATFNISSESYKRQSEQYRVSILIGTVFLVCFSWVSNVNLHFLQRFSKRSLSRIVMCCLIASVLMVVLSWTVKWNMFFMGFVTTTAFVVNIYENYLETEITEKFKKLQIVKQLVLRVQKIFVLCPMPFIVMIVFDEDDIEYCLVWFIGFSLILCAVLFKVQWFWNASQKNSRDERSQSSDYALNEKKETEQNEFSEVNTQKERSEASKTEKVD